MASAKQPINALTGLRFVAALFVFIHHLGGKFGYTLNPYSLGGLAVSFFFVLSGFVLTYAYHDRLNKFPDVVKFYFNRFARIWPLHVVCLILAVSTSKGFGRLQEDDIWFKFLANLFLLQSWFSDKQWVFSFNGVSWSIATEAFFYLMFPLVFLGTQRIKWRLSAMFFLVISAAVAICCLEKTGQFETVDFFRIGYVNPLMRLPDFLVGIIAGQIFLARQRQHEQSHQFWIDSVQELLCVSILVMTCLWVIDANLPQQLATYSWSGSFLSAWFRVEYPVLLFGICVYVFAKSQGFLAKLFSNRIFVYLGDISYAFYMIHFILIRNVFLAHGSYGELAGWQLSLLCLLLSLGAAIVLYEWVEMPMKWLLNIWFHRRPPQLAAGNGAKTFRSAKCFLGLAAIVGSLLVLANNVTRYEPNDSVRRIVENSDGQFRNLRFGSQIKLLGLETNLKAKRLEIRFAWFKAIDFDARRLVTVINGKGKMIGRAQHNQAAIRNSLPGESFEDRIFVPLDAIKPGSEIIVSFRFDDGRKLLVDRGKRRQRNQALVLMNSQQLRQLVDSRSKPRRDSIKGQSKNRDPGS